MIGRRRFVAAVSAVLAMARASAQPAAKTYRIGILGINPPNPQALASDPFTSELRRLGYIEGRNLVIHGRFSGADASRLEGLAAELAALPVDVIVTFSGTSGAVAARKATATIPIVMMTSADPVRGGLVASLAHPGGNVTGNAIFGLELAQKRLQVLAEAVGKPTRIVYLHHRNMRSLSGSEAFKATLTNAAHGLGVQLQPIEVDAVDDLEPAFEAMAKQRVDAVLIDNFAFFSRNSGRLAALALQHRLPSVAEGRDFAEAGGLLTYGVDYDDLARKTAVYVDKILKGAKPAELPVEQASKFVFIVNQKTARVLGLAIPQRVLLRADEVIE